MCSGRSFLLRVVATGTLAIASGCARPAERVTPPPERPSLLLVTLDTTRADALAPEADAAATPAFAALVAVQIFYGTLPVAGKIVLAHIPALALVGFRVGITAAAPRAAIAA